MDGKTIIEAPEAPAAPATQSCSWRPLVCAAWQSYFDRARVVWQPAETCHAGVMDLWLVPQADLLVAAWDPTASSWSSPEMLEICASTCRAHGKTLVATRSAPGAGRLMLFRPDDETRGSATKRTELQASLAASGGISFKPATRESGDTLLCPAARAMPARRRRCLMVNLVDWSTLGSGSAQHQLGLMRAWRRSAYDIRMLAPRPQAASKLPQDLVRSATFVPTARSLGLPRSLVTVFQIVWMTLIRFSWRPDIVFSRVNTLTVLLVAVCRLLNLKVIIDHNGWLAKERRQAGGNSWLASLEELSQSTAAKWANGSRCVTRGMAKALADAGVAPAKIYVAGNGTDTEEFRPIDRSEALAEFKLAPSRDYIGFLGNIVPWHGVDVAIEAFILASSQLPNVDMLIFGSGPSLPDYARRIEDAGLANRIHLMGRIDASRANKAINSFSLGVVPLTLRRDTAFGYSPVKIRDYAAAGCPVLTGAVPDNTELDHQGWLFTHAPDDPAAMGQQLIALFSDPARLRSASEIARAFAVANFDWDVIGTRILQHFDSPTLES